MRAMRMNLKAQKALEDADLQREAITGLAQSNKLSRLHHELIQMQPISLESRLLPNLAMGRRKLEVSANLTESLNLLKQGERAALLSGPESLARLEASIPAEIPPETAHQSSLQALEQTG
jgi:membrane glycosyltransferase